MNPFLLERYFSKYEFSTEYSMCSSDCESHSVEQLLALEQGAQENFMSLGLRYTETMGSSALRQEISALYKTIKPKNILVHCGGEEAIYVLFRSYLNSGDHIIVQTPCYQSHTEIPNSIGCSVSQWKIKVDNNKWALNLEELKRLINSKTKLLVINFPNNPTGYQPSLEKYKQIFDIARIHNVTVFSDEAYRDAEYSLEDKLPHACEIDSSAVSLGLLSKAYGLAGLRVGWLATQNSKILDKASEYKDYTSICNSTASEFLGTLAIRNRNKILTRNRNIVTTNLEILENFFSRHIKLFTWHQPIGGPVAFPKYLGGEVDEFCASVVKECGVLLLPGTTIYHTKENFFRVGFGRLNMPLALERLEWYLKKRM